MTEKVKMTEQQARKIYFFGTRADCEQEFINDLKIQGYILPDPVEEAEDYYRIFKQKDYNMEQEYNFMRDALISCYRAIQIMKPHYEKYKGEKL